jgi:tetratricopeptide (TPR) repeat protein
MSAAPEPSRMPATTAAPRRDWLAAADGLRQRGDRAGAERAYAMHLQQAAADPALMRAALAMGENDIPTAEAVLRGHLRQRPTDIAALRMLAEIAARLARDDDAVNVLGHCLELAPGFTAARQQFALMLNRAGKPAEALSQIELLLARDPASPSYRNLKAVILCHVGEYERAIAMYDELLAEAPGQPRMWMSLGHALKTAGQQERAIAAYRRAIALEPGMGEAWWSLANLKTFRFGDEEVEAMRGQLARGDELPVQERNQFEFALGKALEDRGEYEESFRHYLEGNSLRRTTVAYSADDNHLKVRRAKQMLDSEFFARRAGHGASAADPIFVLGLPRSGSTLIEQILSSHTQVEGTMELQEVIGLTRGLRRMAESRAGGYLEVLATQSADELRALGERYLQRTRIHRKSGAPFFIDKMPNNFQHIGLIQLALPNAKIVDARRHPLACCLSTFKQHFARGQKFRYELAELGRYYRDYVELMAHYDAVLPGRIHRVFYEAMVDDTEAEVRRLLDHCGLPFEDGCLRFYENERAVRTASSEQVRKPIYREGKDHHRHYEPWLGPLREALGDVLERYPDVPAF